MSVRSWSGASSVVALSCGLEQVTFSQLTVYMYIVTHYRTLTLWDDFFEQTKMADTPDRRINNEDADIFLDVN